MATLDPSEIDRYWLNVRAVHSVALPGATVKDIRNWSDRGLVDVAEQNPGTNTPRRYSLASALQISVLRQFTWAGSPLTLAKKLADYATARLRDLVVAGTDFGFSLEAEKRECIFVYGITDGDKVQGVLMTPAEVADELTRTLSLAPMICAPETRLFWLDELIRVQVERYAEQRDELLERASREEATE